MRRRHALPLVALAGICALALVPSGTAAKAHRSTHKYATQISIKLLPEKGKIKGKVTSEKDACVKGREVFLNFLGSEEPLDPPEFANGRGVYIILSDPQSDPPPPLPEGTYKTHVKKLELGHNKICKAAESEVLSNPPQ